MTALGLAPPQGRPYSTERLATDLATPASAAALDYRGSVSITDPRYAAVGDGIEDDTAAIQAAIDANKGGTIIIPPGVFLHAGVLLSGATYNNTKIISRGGVLKLKVRTAHNFQSTCFAGVIVHNCSGVEIDLHCDGNRAAQPDIEAIYCVLLAGASRPKITYLRCDEVRGDGLHVAQATLASSSAIGQDVWVRCIEGGNAVDDGCNLFRIVSVQGMQIDNLRSRKIGGTVAGTLQSGGFLIEPTAGYHLCEDITLRFADVTTAGRGGIAVLGKAVTNDATRDWNCRDIRLFGRVVRTGTSGAGLAASNLTKFRDCHVELSLRYATTRGEGWSIDLGDRITGWLKARNVSTGVILAYAEELRDSDIALFVADYTPYGILAVKPTRSRFTGRVYGNAAANGFAIVVDDVGRGAISQVGVVYSIDAPYDGVNIRAFRAAGSVVYGVGTLIRDCDFTGYASPAVTCDAIIPKANVRGLSFLPSIPTDGAWVLGDVVWDSTPTAGAAPGWICTVTDGFAAEFKALPALAA